VSAAERLGRGFPSPVRPDPRAARIPYVEGADKVRQSIRVILDTDPGERVMRPTFGCPLRRFLMAPNTVATRAAIRHEVELALATWEPRIELRRVEVTAGADPSLVDIAIAYLHRRTRRADDLVYVLPVA
jgi:phage baseplate assembly protein W